MFVVTAALQGRKTGDKRIRALVNEVSALRLTANYKDGYGEKSSADLLALTHFSHDDKHIKVLSSTRSPKVNGQGPLSKMFSC